MGAIYTAAKMWHYPEQLEALKSGDVAAPVHIRLKPTNVCNHNCYFCAYRTDDLDLGGDMNLKDRLATDKMAEIVEDIVEMGVKAVTFTGGGEPLLYPTIVETIEQLAAGGVNISALTNASQLKGKRADVLARHATWVRVSIDGWDGPSYAEYRGVDEQEFDKVIANLTAFSALESDCVLGASIIVDHRNAPHIAELAKTLKIAGVAHAKISACVVSNEGADNNAYHAKFTDVVREQIALARDLDGDGFEVIDHYHELSERFDKDYESCPFLQFLTVIGADGEVYTCQDKAYTKSGKLGSIQDRRFKDFWFSEDNKQAMAALNPSKVCGHHCVAEGKNRLLHDYLESEPAHRPFV
jgi:radical SAM protein with 4Fe4S-binding SPASM domain